MAHSLVLAARPLRAGATAQSSPPARLLGGRAVLRLSLFLCLCRLGLPMEPALLPLVLP